MFSFNQSQSGIQQVSNASGRWFRTRNTASSQSQNSAFLRDIFRMPSLRLRSQFDKWRHDLLARVYPSLAHLPLDVAEAVNMGRCQRAEKADDYWKMDKVSSAQTYFENNNGFRPSELYKETPSSTPTTTVIRSRLGRFLDSTKDSPQLAFARGFKTKRSVSEGTTPFTPRGHSSRTSQDSDTKELLQDIFKKSKQTDAAKARTEADVLHEILQSSALSPEERNKVHAAISGYAAGFAQGKNEPKTTEVVGGGGGGFVLGRLSSSSESGSKESGDTKQQSSKFWYNMGNLKNVLFIAFMLMALTQFTNLSGLRFTRGVNEITPETIEVTFDDVKGCDEAKKELQEIVEFLMNPDKFSALGGKLPKGCLLMGPPGTGKTLLARAVAGQAGVPFFHAAGPEFDEVLVGQGARRVRDLFKTAKASAPCVIFIDEIDSVGSQRTNSALHPYANQTINQLLSEMDGFMPNDGVIVLGATNRAADLDKALLRPGRFDTQVKVPFPDLIGRKEILMLYLSKIKHDDSVDPEKLAKLTVGFSGADIENMVNTSAIRAAVEGKSYVTMAEFEYSHDKHRLGTDWKSRIRDKEDLKITAYHEAGHALVSIYTKDSDPLYKVTIAAKGDSGGHTAFINEKDTWHETKSQALANLDMSMGGRAAEELVFGKDKVTGGASADLKTATMIVEYMVKKAGMSEKVGLRVIPSPNETTGGVVDLGPGTVEIIDEEINVILGDSYKRAGAILKSHRRELDAVADALLNYETLDADDVKAILKGDVDSVAQKKSLANSILGLNKSTRANSPIPTTPNNTGGGSGGNVLVQTST